MGWTDSVSSFFGVGSGDPGNAARDSLTANGQALGNNAQQLGGYGQQWANAYNQNQAGINSTIGMLQANANGANSVSMEQARQNLQQAQASQMSMAAGAAPQNQAMAARTAMINAGQQGSGIMGQQALAGVQERNAAINSLGSLQMQQAGMNMNGSLGAYGAANQAYGTANQANQAVLANPQKSWWSGVVAPAAAAGMQAAGMALGGPAGGAAAGAMNANNPSQFWQGSTKTGSLYPGGY